MVLDSDSDAYYMMACMGYYGHRCGNDPSPHICFKECEEQCKKDLDLLRNHDPKFSDSMMKASNYRL